MSPPWAIVSLVAGTAVFMYLVARGASYVWGLPPLDRRLLRALELGREPPRSERPLRSVDLWTLLVLLMLVELAFILRFADAIAASDPVQGFIFGAHFVLALAWLAFLRARYASRRTEHASREPTHGG